MFLWPVLIRIIWRPKLQYIIDSKNIWLHLLLFSLYFLFIVVSYVWCEIYSLVAIQLAKQAHQMLQMVRKCLYVILLCIFLAYYNSNNNINNNSNKMYLYLASEKP